MQALPMMMGMGMGLGGDILGGISQRKAQKRLSQMQDRQTATIQAAERMASGGALPAGTQSQLGKYREQLRAMQGERGIFESGVAAGQEAQVMPEIEQKLREQQVQQLLGIAGGYGEMVPTQAGIVSGQPSFGSSMGRVGAAVAPLDLQQMLKSMGMK